MRHPGKTAGLTGGIVIDGRYEIVRPLGAGGMGEVYAARRKSLGDEVAIKRLLPDQDTPANRQRFATEAQAAAHIRHPNVIQVFDYGDDPEVGPYLVMEKLDGPTLAEELASGPVPLGRALWVFSSVCAAIEAGHRRGIVHRDLKPANVMIAPTDDGRQVVKVLDFGLAVDLRLPGRDITAPGAVIGTVAYMAPEQTEGTPASTRSDVFALGVMLYEMVSGRLPFEGNSSLDTLMAINGGRYRPVQELVPGLPGCVIEAIDAALVRDPTRRPESPERLAQLAAAGLVVTPPAARPHGPTRSRPMAAVRPAHEVVPTRDTEATMPVYARFVGRGNELRRLDAAFAQALHGKPPLVLLSGDAGLGKSRLAERFAADARERGALALTGRFFDYTGSRPPPLETFVTMLRAAGTAGEDEAARVQDSLDTGGDDARWSAFAAIADALAGQAAGRPLILTLDDLQWASRVDLDLIDHLHRNLGPRATLIVATARPGDGGELTAWRARRTSAILDVPLAPFDESELREWLEAVFKGIRLGSLDARRLLRTTGGNPFALVEITRHLVARGELVRDDAGWRLRGLTSVELPDSVAAVVRVRLGELPAPERAVLETAAVLGDEFRVTTLAAACNVSEQVLDDALDRGYALRLVSDRDVSAGNDYRFTTTLIRQVLYDELPARARRRMHKDVARALATVYGTDDNRFAHVFGYHHHAVGAWPEALACNVRAASEGLTRGDLDLAQQAIGRADEAVAQLAAGGGGETSRALTARLDYLAGCVATQLGELDAATTRLRRAIATAEGEGAADVAIDARIELARATAAQGELVAAAAEASRAAEAATAARRSGACARRPRHGRRGPQPRRRRRHPHPRRAGRRLRRRPAIGARPRLPGPGLAAGQGRRVRGLRGRRRRRRRSGARRRPPGAAAARARHPGRGAQRGRRRRRLDGAVAGGAGDGAPHRRSPPRGHLPGQPRRGLGRSGRGPPRPRVLHRRAADLHRHRRSRLRGRLPGQHRAGLAGARTRRRGRGHARARRRDVRVDVAASSTRGSRSCCWARPTSSRRR